MDNYIVNFMFEYSFEEGYSYNSIFIVFYSAETKNRWVSCWWFWKCYLGTLIIYLMINYLCSIVVYRMNIVYCGFIISVFLISMMGRLIILISQWTFGSYKNLNRPLDICSVVQCEENTSHYYFIKGGLYGERIMV